MTAISWLAGETSVDSWQLRRHTVRINHPDGRLLGSGFFVAPGWVMTAAHVVFDNRARQPLTTVTVTPSDQDVGTTGVPAEVTARSPAATGTSVWPFPDLALLRLAPLADWVDQHPCVWLADGHPLGTSHAYGFPVREQGVTPSGGPATFTFEGVTGDGYLQLKEGQSAPGLSGAPLLCPIQRGVVGVVVTTRDEYSDLGGLAAPISALGGDFPDVADPLVEQFRAIRELNSAAVLTDRAQWHRVLPIPAARSALAQPWDNFQRKDRSLPAEMLLADAGVVPYLFRDADLAEVQRWCEQPSAMEVWRFTGPGGAGKTRHAIELCKIMHGRGWLVGFWDGGTATDTGFDVADVPLPRLIAVDYIEAFAAKALRVLLSRLRLRATPLAPVRVVLLTRTTSGDTDVLREIGKTADSGLRNVLNGAPDPVVVGGFPTAQRNHLFDKAVSAFRQAWFGDRSPAPAAPPDLAGERFGTPLEVLLAAFDQALSNGASHGDSTTVERALDHEEHYWSFTAPRDLSDRDRRAAVALATLAGADDAETGEALLAVLPVFAGEGAAGVRWRTLRWLSELYAGSARLNPLRPDRLGEALVAIMLAEQDDGGLRLLRAILALADNAQVSRSLDLLARLATTDPTVAEIVALVLSRDHRALVERAEREAQGLPDRPGRLDLAIGLQRLLTTELVKRLDALAPDRSDRLALAMSYDKIGDLAWRSGRIDRAERLYGRAFFIRTRLAAAHQDDVNLARAQSISYNKLGDVAHRLSTSRARKLYERGLKIRERLARDNPDSATLASDLATSYDRLASVAAENGPRDQAERLYRRGLTIRERLARAEPDNPAFARDLAMSYDKLGDLAKEEGRPAAAKPLYEQGLAIRERLRAADLDNVTVARDLSNSYERLGDLAVDAKQFGQGRERYEQARQIRQRLSEAEPDNIILASDLARSYNRLGTVALMWDHRDEAHDLYERGLEIVERLRRTAPRDTALAHDASVFLSNLGDVATDDERHFDAEALYCRGLEVAQRLLATEPKNVTFARGVAEFYERRGQLLHHQPEARSRAETLLGAAVLFRRKLHDGDRERGDLAEELAYALLLLAETVGGEAADRLLNEIVVLLDGYEQSAKLTGRGQELRRLAHDRLARR